MIRVVDVDYIKDYTLSITFSDGVTKVVDLQPYLNGGVFEQLKDLSQFRQYGLNHWTIEWACGVDLAPEFLYGLPYKNDDEFVLSQVAEQQAEYGKIKE
ncbi:MAG: DUF2442 domain-containing protein [Bacteroidales bacterium]|nr:DUF2442 domain-containing protein [Bacteroidales bacterium]